MSGICGIFNLDGAPVEASVLHKMTEEAADRGPDGIRYWIHGNIGLAHLALNVTPESVRERQPFLSNDGMVCVTADSRVDNRDELVSALTAKGCLREKDPTDAELILAAYECWGVKCPVHILGDFAFAVWDDRKQQLFCVRDACGVKPLHYSWVGQTLCFASEVQQILENPAVPRRLDEVAMADYLSVNLYDQASTMFVDVRRLPPARRLIARRTGVRLERYWDIDPSARTTYHRDEEYAEHFLHLFRRSVSDRLRTAAKTVGLAMSGGLDSCSIAAVAQKTLSTKGGSPRLITYSWIFDKLTDCDERAFMGAMAAELGVEIEYIPAERFWFLREPVPLRPSLESPCLWSESVMREMFRRVSEQGGRVILTGEGGDGLSTGTALFYADRLLRGHIGVLWELARHARKKGERYHRLLYTRIARPLVPDSVIRVLRRLVGRSSVSLAPDWISPAFSRRTGLADRLANPPLPRRFSSLARQDVYRRIAVVLGVGPAMYWYDNAAARFGLEARHPFVDRRLVEFVVSIPPEQLFCGEQRKLILRRAMAGILPEDIRQRRDKTLLSSFVGLSLREKEVEQIKRLLKAPLLGKMGVVDAERLRSIYEDYCAGGAVKPAFTLFPPIILELWLRKYYSILQNKVSPGRDLVYDAFGDERDG